MDLNLLLALARIPVLFLIMLATYPISALMNGSLTVGVWRAERGAGEAVRSFVETVRASLPFFWRTLGTLLLFTGGYLLVNLFISVLRRTVTVLTLGLGLVCMLPLSFLQYPVVLIWYVWMERARVAVVLDDRAVLEAARHAWAVLRKNIWIYTLLGVVLYFRLGMLMAALLMPLFMPLFFVPMALLSENVGRVARPVLGVIGMVFFPVFAGLQGAVLVLMKSGWLLTYLRLRQLPAEPRPGLPAVPAA